MSYLATYDVDLTDRESLEKALEILCEESGGELEFEMSKNGEMVTYIYYSNVSRQASVAALSVAKKLGNYGIGFNKKGDSITIEMDSDSRHAGTIMKHVGVKFNRLKAIYGQDLVWKKARSRGKTATKKKIDGKRLVIIR